MPTDRPQPTPAELAILNVLWRRGKSTVRDVLEELNRDRAGDSPGSSPAGYTTVLKLMQIMTDKGLLARDEQGRTHVYRPAQPEAQTLKRLAGDLLDRAFGGSARKLVAAALSSKRATPEELDDIRRLLDDMKGDVP